MYFCTLNTKELKRYSIFILFLALLWACKSKQERVVTPWGEEVAVGEDGAWKGVLSEQSDTVFDLDDIEHSGELIALTLSGPQTCYDFRGSRLGLHFMLCQQFADSLGVRLRVEICRDSSDMFRRLRTGDADLMAYPVNAADSVSPGWVVSDDKPQLAEAIRRWYRPERLTVAQQEEQLLLRTGGVNRKVYASMLDKTNGVISRYDAYFQQYCRTIRWDWRLMAAQCYQESTFDPEAVSWAGARGLMQIMPQTADRLGLERSQLHHPEKNIAASARYLAMLEQSFADIQNRYERQNFVLAAYNGGPHHIRDAMRLAQRDGRDAHRWSNVSDYVLKLANPEFYKDTVVKYGYMRGSETVEYVRAIRERYQQYRGVKTKSVVSSPQKSRNGKHRSKYRV